MSVAGIDIGTSGCKIVVYSNDCKFENSYYKEYDVTRREGMHEIDLGNVLKCVFEVTKQAIANYDIEAIGVTSFGETFTVLDENDEIIAPSMLYTDLRGTEECKELVEKLGEEKLAFKIGTVPHSMFSLPKLMWIKNNMPNEYAKAKRVLLVQDFIVYMLTGVAQIDFSLAARTMAFNVKEKCYDKEILEAAQVKEDLFSKPVPAGTVAGGLTDKAKELLGTTKDIKIVTCTQDQIAAVVGAGIFNADEAMDGIGTVECIPIVLDKLPDDLNVYKMGYSFVPFLNTSKYVCYVLSYVGGVALKWIRDNFAEIDKLRAEEENRNVYAMMDEKVSDNPTGILVLPYFTGAATPYMNPYAKGSIIGLTFEHTKYDVYKAMMEGVSYEIRKNLDIVKNYGMKPKFLRATGGGATSDVWLQIKADILNVPITALDCAEIGGLGTALMAGAAVGVFDNLEKTATENLNVRKTFIPNPEKNKIYEKYVEKYSNLYELVKDLY